MINIFYETLMTILNDDCIELIWKKYYKVHCVNNLSLKICPQCKKQKNEHKNLCNKCMMIDAGFTPGFVMLFTAWKLIKY